MSPLELVLALLIAAGIPLAFVAVIYALDLYASSNSRLILICFGWGAIGGVALSYLFNTYVAVGLIQQFQLSLVLLYVGFAPVAEELLKSVSLLYTARRPEFTYFVDGAIYGFAGGIGFSITESFIYIRQNPGAGIVLSLVRAFSTCLMHGTAAALVGVAVGRFRFERRSGRWLALAGGWLVAILLHAVFNAVSQTGFVSPGLVAPLSVGIGLAGVVTIAAFIGAGLREQRQWLAETLNRKVGVTTAEVRAAQSISAVSEVLEPIYQQFPDKAEQVEDLILQQAQLGIKRKVHQQTDDPQLGRQLAAEIDIMQADMEALRKRIGPYVMMFVRSVFPEGALNVWSNLELFAARTGPADLNRWSQMLTHQQSSGPSQGIFAKLQHAQNGDSSSE